MKHNNVIPNAHFRKHWQEYVRTWFNQPARKHRRRAHRQEKAAAIFPRPVSGAVKPVVHCPTNKYSRKLRFGRGFSVDELKAAKINRREARGLGISVDFRRRNKSEESLRQNVARLNAYKANLVLFPKKSNNKKLKKGEATKDERSKVTQHKGVVLPIAPESKAITSRVITAAEKEASVVKVLRKARFDQRSWGRLKIRADKKKAEEENA